MNTNELLNDKKALNNSQDLLKDLIAGDPYALKRFEDLNLDMNAIKTALNFITNNDSLSAKEKAGLLQDSWRINFRSKPPTLDEFLSEKYLGYTAVSLWPRVKIAFKEFLDPTKSYRNLILYPHIGWGKDQPLDSKVYLSKKEYKLMRDIKPGDRILSPNGFQTEVLVTYDWSKNDVYELEMENGEKIKTGPYHLHHVSYRNDEKGNPIWENVETLFIINHPSLELTFQKVDVENESLTEKEIEINIVKLKSIKYIDKEPTKCITVDNPNGLYITDKGIVTHNSFLSTLITLYLDTCVSFMRNPAKYFGVSQATSFSSMLVSYSLKKSSELLVSPFLNILESSPFFEKVTRRDAMQDLVKEYQLTDKPIDKLYYTTAAKDKSSVLEFDSGLSVKIASSPAALLGLTLVSSTFSELSYFTDAGKSSDYIMRLWNDGVSRIESRLHGNYYGRAILDSSPNTLTSAIDQWIVNESWKSPLNYVVKGSMWDCNPKEYEQEFKKHQTFKVYTGGKGQPPRILEENDPLLESPELDPSKILEVPNSQKQFFIDDLNKSLKDRAGIPTGAADSIITDYKVIEDMFDNNLRNIYLNIEAPADMNPKELIWNQVKDVFFKYKLGKYEFYYLPHIARCISVDQSEVSDVTSISMAHVERYKDTGETYYVVDFTITIVPTRERINLLAIEDFIKDLRYSGNVNIAKVSFDSFQSAATLQNLKRAGFEVEKLSVDKTTGPYLNLISLMNRRRISVGKNIFLKNNLKCLHISQSKKSDHIKIDHDSSRSQVLTGDSDWNSSFIGYYGKDVSDSVAAVVELCSKEFPVAQVNWNPDSVQSTSSSSAEDYQEAKKMLEKFLYANGLQC